jgi:hypothetical protein
MRLGGQVEQLHRVSARYASSRAAARLVPGTVVDEFTTAEILRLSVGDHTPLAAHAL